MTPLLLLWPKSSNSVVPRFQGPCKTNHHKSRDGITYQDVTPLIYSHTLVSLRKRSGGLMGQDMIENNSEITAA
ncbi:hypothetical protein I7I50_09774 [Histoplasma capsulatum G186AR]|uniref:Uncharacterized protein n=1 Tax=Ajellomyces capsulatus TaxID=5037 RepID=A0A8H7Z394_AJECA|nr:hypothetical protein I7I52_10910 [Histoplasma capsulatum]QSS68714.1 hypothetical protein I7I50_09774 [Histoplasma capsulatum G186AR]